MKGLTGSNSGKLNTKVVNVKLLGWIVFAPD